MADRSNKFTNPPGSPRADHAWNRSVQNARLKSSHSNGPWSRHPLRTSGVMLKQAMAKKTWLFEVIHGDSSYVTNVQKRQFMSFTKPTENR